MPSHVRVTPVFFSRIRGSRGAGVRGATLVEFAIVLPLFVLLIFGAIDFGWAFGQFLDVKQGAREGARLAIVNQGRPPGPPATDENREDLITAIKGRTADLNNQDEVVWVGQEASPSEGRLAVVCVTYPLRSLSGVSRMFLSGRLKSQVKMRIEKEPNWTVSGGQNPCS